MNLYLITMVKIMNTNKIIIFSSIVGIVLIVLCPTIYKVVKNHEDNLYDVVNKKVIEAAITCKNTGKCPNEKVTLKELYDNDLIEFVSDPISKKIYNENSYVISTNGSYEFVVEN